MKHIAVLFLLFTVAACATPPRANIAMTMEQRQDYNYPAPNIEVVYGDEVKEKLEKYDAANARELAGEKNPTYNDTEEGKSIKQLIHDSLVVNLLRHPKGTMDKKLKVTIEYAVIGNIGKTLLIGNMESLRGIVQVIEPETDDIISEYKVYHNEDGGGGIGGLFLSAIIKRANVRLSQGLGRDITAVLKTDVP